MLRHLNHISRPEAELSRLMPEVVVLRLHILGLGLCGLAPPILVAALLRVVLLLVAARIVLRTQVCTARLQQRGDCHHLWSRTERRSSSDEAGECDVRCDACMCGGHC